MVLSHWNSMAYAESLSSSMNNRELSTNAEENSRYEADVTWSISHGILSLSKVLSLGCLRKWLQKSLLMQLFIKNMSFLNTVPQPVAEKKKEIFTGTERRQLWQQFQGHFKNPSFPIYLSTWNAYVLSVILHFTFCKKKQALVTT